MTNKVAVNASQAESFFTKAEYLIGLADPIVFAVYLLTIFVFLAMIFHRRCGGGNAQQVGEGDRSARLELMAVVFGSTAGICVGFFAGAAGPEEQKYAMIGGAVWGVIGYAASKLDDLFKFIIERFKEFLKEENKKEFYIKFSMFTCCFILTLMLTLNIRFRYAEQDREAKEKKQATIALCQTTCAAQEGHKFVCQPAEKSSQAE